ncbi:MAG: META domain-containing protein [Dehalococcoidales bacterium]|nr:MAG: META domain-containing protein [Dehalococcoidales bacterium]
MNNLVKTLIIPLVLLVIVFVACKFEPMTFDDEPEDEPLDFENIEWVLESFGEPGNIRLVIEGSAITASFSSATHEVSGSAGCNYYSGDYEADNSELSIPAVGNTEMACMEPEGVMEQEQQYLRLLILVESYETDDGQLRITCSDGSVMVFAGD